MPKRRLRSISELQSTLREIMTYKLTTIEGRRSSLENSQREMIESLNRMDELYCSLSPMTTRKLHDVEDELARVRQEHQQHLERTLLQTARAKTAARIADRDETERQLRSARNTLMDLIETCSGPDESSQT
jgi:C4-dicarboxylate-specific signal transduction histidine kinase